MSVNYVTYQALKHYIKGLKELNEQYATKTD